MSLPPVILHILSLCALSIGGLILTCFALVFIYVILTCIVSHLAGTKQLEYKIDAVIESNRKLHDTIGELRGKVEKYQRTKKYHKEDEDGKNT